ncbi:MAG: low molecular weight protein-tyrosine-phosphatase [Erysipelotrichaceae bacterium]|nr:low molecular weight phosphotyrosine protein phosphatase [Bacillota bacterium]MDY3092702.1 low molecular weight protein-tyrosine-phosphatase [Erysipelotrichaceae bacterium]
MIKVLFVCHGNICRSVMAEYIMKDYIHKLKRDDEFLIESRAVSNEEIGNDIYYAAKDCLKRHGIPYANHHARRINRNDYEEFDYILMMDKSNIRNMSYYIDDDLHKVELLLKDRDISDPWYTRDFDRTYDDLCTGIIEFINRIDGMK